VHAGQEHHRPRAGHQQQRGAEIGLHQHQQHRRRGHRQGRQQPEGVGDAVGRQPCVIGRQRHHQRHFHRLGGLELDDAEVDPALRAHAGDADELHRHQQRHDEQIGRGRHQPPEPDVDQRHGRHAGETERETRHLARRPGVASPPATE
jgi:hypothetical protein